MAMTNDDNQPLHAQANTDWMIDLNDVVTGVDILEKAVVDGIGCRSLRTIYSINYYFKNLNFK